MIPLKLPAGPRSAAAMALLLSLCASVAQAQQTFNITVPKRGFGAPLPPETSLVKVIFEGPGVGSAVPQVGGNDFVDAANPANPCTAATPACLSTFSYNSLTHGAKLDRRSATSLQIAFDLQNDLETNRCGDLQPSGTTNRNFTVTLPAGAPATSYRIASYTVPERATADNTAPKCDASFRRVDLNQATAVVANPTIAALPGRMPLDMVLILDRSGSMTGGFSSGTDQRINRLKTSAATFISTWQSTGTHGSPQDRLGLVVFDGNAQAIPLDGANFFKERSSTTAWDNAITQVGTLSAGGSTTVGGSVTKAFEILSGSASLNDATFVLMTDGEQNTAPSFTGANPVRFACSASAPCVVGGVDLNATRLMDRATTVLTVGLGPTGSSFFQLLDDISHETAGRNSLVFDAMDLDAAFVNNLIAALKGNTLSLNSRAIGTIAATEPASQPLKAAIDGSVKRISVVMTWAGGNGESAELLVAGPGGASLNPVQIQRGAFFRVLTYDIAGPSTVGEWQATVVRRPGRDNPALRYHMSVVSVEGRLTYQFHESARLGTGVPVKLRVELGWDGTELADLPSGSIKATIERPGENLGNILHDSTKNGDPKNVSGDAQDALAAKIETLVASDNLVDRTAPKPLPDTIDLVHTGHGIYEGTFDQATVGGHYKLRYDLAWDDPRTDKISRTETIDRSVPVAVTPANTQSLTTVNSGAGTATVVFTPKDANGNFVGPGYADAFVVTVTGGGTPVLPLTDASNRGEYTLQITGIPAGVDPQVVITYRGETVRDSVLSKLDDVTTGPGPGGPGCQGLECLPWWVWILILILILIIILFFRRRSTP